MIPRIKSIFPLQDYILRVCFDSGEVVLYDVKDDIRTLDDYKVLETEYGLFQNAQLDSSRIISPMLRKATTFTTFCNNTRETNLSSAKHALKRFRGAHLHRDTTGDDDKT